MLLAYARFREASAEQSFTLEAVLNKLHISECCHIKMKYKIDITVEEISKSHISKLTEMVFKLWPDCKFEEEFDNSKLNNEK